MEVSEAEASFRARARAMWWAGGAVLSGALACGVALPANVIDCRASSPTLDAHTPPLVFMQPLGHEYIGSTTNQSSIGLI